MFVNEYLVRLFAAHSALLVNIVYVFHIPILIYSTGISLYRFQLKGFPEVQHNYCNANCETFAYIFVSLATSRVTMKKNIEHNY